MLYSLKAEAFIFVSLDYVFHDTGYFEMVSADAIDQYNSSINELFQNPLTFNNAKMIVFIHC